MPFQILQGDITKVQADVIVNAANSRLEMGGGVCGAIFSAAGIMELERECRQIGHCDVGDAVITTGHSLAAKYIIHTVGPVWRGGNESESALLRCCYNRSLVLATEYDCHSIAFPLISSGIFGYPKKQAIDIAASEICDFLLSHEMDIFLVLFDAETYYLSNTIV